VVRNRKSPAEFLRYLETEVYPAFGDKLLNDVTALDVQAPVYRKRHSGREAAAIKIRQAIKLLFDYAVHEQQATINPASMVATRYIGRARKRSRAMGPKEIRLYLRTIYGSNMRRQFKLALHMLLLTLKRKSELLLARWGARRPPQRRVDHSRAAFQERQGPNRLPLCPGNRHVQGIALSRRDSELVLPAAAAGAVPSPRVRSITLSKASPSTWSM
jgi:hypothetical protein